MINMTRRLSDCVYDRNELVASYCQAIAMAIETESKMPFTLKFEQAVNLTNIDHILKIVFHFIEIQESQGKLIHVYDGTADNIRINIYVAEWEIQK